MREGLITFAVGACALIGTIALSSADTPSDTSPTVTAVSASTGPTTGGLNMTLTGTNFIGATQVNFGSTITNDFIVVSSTHIIVTSTSGSGTTNVTVTTPNGTSATSAANQFTFSGGAGTPVTETANHKAYNWSSNNTGRRVPYHSVLSPWGTGTPSSWSITNYPNTFPNQTYITINGAAQSSIYGSPDVIWGYYGFGGSQPPGNPSIPPKQVSAINTIVTHHNVTINNDSGITDIIYDFFLQQSPTYFGYSYPGLQFEIEVSVHLPAWYSHWVSSFSVKNYTDKYGTKWSMAYNTGASPPMIIFFRADLADQLVTTFDIKELLTAAKNQGVAPLTFNEYFMGMTIASETDGGVFNWTLNSWIQSYT
jgi:hypothetical protein